MMGQKMPIPLSHADVLFSMNLFCVDILISSNCRYHGGYNCDYNSEDNDQESAC